MKIRFTLTILIVCLHFSVEAQSKKEIKPFIGINQSIVRKFSNPMLLPDNTSGTLNLENSESDINLNWGLLYAFAPTNNLKFKVISGVHIQSLSFSTKGSANYLGGKFEINSINQVNLIDIPLLLSYKANLGKLSYGIETGIYKSIYQKTEIKNLNKTTLMDGKITSESYESKTSGFTSIKDRLSLHVSPFARYQIHKGLHLEIQPYLRNPIWKNNFLIWNPTTKVGQWGINTGLVIEF